MAHVVAASSKCGRKTRKGTPCRHPKGFRTDHPGEGPCWLHGGDTPIKNGRYSKIQRPRIRELAAELEADPEPLNLLPELAQARALYVDYLERFDVFQEALLAWHESWKEGSEDKERKPRQILDLASAHKLLSEVTRIAKRIEDVRAKNAISRADFWRVLTELGRAVDLIVEDQDLRAKIHEAWLEIRLA